MRTPQRWQALLLFALLILLPGGATVAGGGGCSVGSPTIGSARSALITTMPASRRYDSNNS